MLTQEQYNYNQDLLNDTLTELHDI